MKLFLSIFLLLFLLACGGKSGSESGKFYVYTYLKQGTYFQAFPDPDPNKKGITLDVYNFLPNNQLVTASFVYLDSDFKNGHYEKGYYWKNTGTFSNQGSTYKLIFNFESCPPIVGSETLIITSDNVEDHIFMKEVGGGNPVQFVSLLKYMDIYKEFTDLLDESKQNLIYANQNDDCNKF